MRDAPQPAAGSDDVAMVTSLAAFAAGVGLATPIGVAAACVPPALFWLTRRRSWMAGCLLSGGSIAVYAAATGGFERALAAYKQAYLGFSTAGLPLAQTFSAWLALAANPPIWAPAAGLGLIIGAAGALCFDARSRSALVALSDGRCVCARTRAPIAGFLHERVNRRPARRGHAVVLGTAWETGRIITVTDKHLNRHLMLGGTTGVGKSTDICNLVEGSLSNGVVIVDGKGDIELANQISKYARIHNKRFYIFEPTGRLRSVVYNPLASGDYTSLTDRLLTLREWTEPYYLVIGKSILQTTLKTLLLCGVPLDIPTVVASLDLNFLARIAKTKAKEATDAEGKAPFESILKEIGSLYEFEKFIAGIKAELSNIARSAIGHLFDTTAAARSNTPILNLKKAREERAIVYFCLPALLYPLLAANIGKVAINDLKYVTGTTKSPWTIIMDEFSVFAGDNVLYLLNQGRSYGLRVILAVQSFSDISRGVTSNGTAFKDQVLASINTYVIHRLNVAADREYIASLAGTNRSIGITSQTVGGKGTGAASTRHTKEFVMHPDEIRELMDYEAFVINCNTGTATQIKTRYSAINKEHNDG
jgi:hypothetical protein